MTARPKGRRPRTPRDPYGIGPVTGFIAPALAVVALVVIAVFTLEPAERPAAVRRRRPGDNGNNGNRAARPITPAPSNVVIIEPEVAFKGSIVYAKAGNIWIQTGTTTSQQLTSAGTDSMPAFSDDGQWIYFIRIDEGRGKFPPDGGGRGPGTTSTTPALMRVKPDGTGRSGC